MSVLDQVAAQYADEFTTAEALADLARDRLRWYMRDVRRCAGCGVPLIGRRVDARTCSRKCRRKSAKKFVEN